jgi:RHS repeat-associated protein
VALYFYHLDHLGTPRVITDVNGNAVSKHKYLPFGEELSPPASTNTHEFTGHERDAETGLDYMLGRMYGQGSTFRFLSVDPGEDTDPNLPQSWNKYAYVRNRPLNMTDPTGRCGASNPADPSTCKINPDPDGDGKANITFKNDVAGAPSTDQYVTVATATMVESAVMKSGVDSVNISSTTGSTGANRGPDSRHGKGQAVDINEVNGKPVDQSKPAAASTTDVAKVQDAFAKEPNIRENYGPTRNEKTSTPGGQATPANPNNTKDKKIIDAHKDHVHVSGQN